MIDAVDARAQCRIDAVGAMRMGRDLAAQCMGGIDDLLELIVGHLLVGAGRGVGEDPARRGDLDPVGSMLDRVAYCPSTVVRTVTDGFGFPELQEL